jgi:hypothetical protein
MDAERVPPRPISLSDNDYFPDSSRVLRPLIAPLWLSGRYLLREATSLPNREPSWASQHLLVPLRLRPTTGRRDNSQRTMSSRPTYQKLAIYISRQLHLELKLASIGEHRSLSDFGEELLSNALRDRRRQRLLRDDADDDHTG